MMMMMSQRTGALYVGSRWRSQKNASTAILNGEIICPPWVMYNGELFIKI